MDPLQLILDPAALKAPIDLQVIFGQTLPLEVDAGCGKGRFLVARAKASPQTCFLGIDRQQKRLEKVARKLGRESLSNTRLLNMEIGLVVENMLPPLSVSAFYIFFPDPWPKRRHHRRRLFSPPFMDSLYRALLPNGHIHTATDHQDYHEWIRRLFRGDLRFQEAPAFQPADEERSDFEITFTGLGQPIYRCSFTKPDKPAQEGIVPPLPRPG